MKSFQFLCVAFLLSSAAALAVDNDGNSYVAGIPRVSLSGRSLTPAADTPTDPSFGCTASTYGATCASCTEMDFCIGAESQGNETCPLGFCDPATNTCTSTMPSGCSTSTAGEYTCSAEGFFPSPNDCAIYYYCEAAGSTTATVYDCPTGYVYDALVGACKKKVYASDCVTIKCTTAKTSVVHARNPNFYAFCNDSLKPILFKCPANKQFVNTGCSYVCKAAGYFAGMSASQYYLCSKSGTTYTVTTYDCPTGMEYNTAFVCVKV